MPNQVIKLKDFSAKTGQSYFFDNNIWMFLFCPIASSAAHKQRAYSSLLSKLILLKSPIFVNSLVLSEFSNRYLKLDFNMVNKNPETAGKFPDYKRDYVGSEQFKNTIKEVKINIEKILRISEKASDEFSSINTVDLLSIFREIGFNDAYYVTVANKKSWIVVSDDSDLTSSKIPDKNLTILTA